MCGSEHEYLHQLAAAVRSVLGPAIYVYTTDPPWLVTKGSMPGTEVYTCVRIAQTHIDSHAFAAISARCGKNFLTV
jgi:hypothetical protein